MKKKTESEKSRLRKILIFIQLAITSVLFYDDIEEIMFVNSLGYSPIFPTFWTDYIPSILGILFLVIYFISMFKKEIIFFFYISTIMFFLQFYFGGSGGINELAIDFIAITNIFLLYFLRQVKNRNDDIIDNEI
jgi:hypothetical protein